MRTVRQIKHNRSDRNGSAIKYIVIHDTGNFSRGANANAHFEYFNNGSRGSSADFFVDDTQVLCVNNYYKYYTWHCGDGRGKYGVTNSNSVGVEFCVNAGSDRAETLKKTVRLVRELMNELSVPIERVVRHYDASRKNCPQSMSKNDWAEWFEFKECLKGDSLTMSQYDELKSRMDELNKKLDKLINPMIYNYIDYNMPEWAHKSVKWAVDNGIIKGDGSGLNLDDKDLRYITILYRLKSLCKTND